MAMAWSVLRPPVPSLLLSLPQCRTANVEEKMENGECRFMCVFMAPVFRGRPQSQIVNAALGWRWLSTSSSDKCLGRGWSWVILVPEYCLGLGTLGRGEVGIGSTSVCLRRGFDKMIINAFLIIVMASRSARNRITFPIAIFHAVAL